MIESIGSITAEPISQTAGSSSLGQAELFKVLLTQLSFQDPLKPLDNREFITQLAQFSGLEINRDVSDRLSTLLSMQSVTQSMGLLGETVSVDTENGRAITGNVTAIVLKEGVPKITIQRPNGEYVPDLSVSDVSIMIREKEAI